MPVIHVLVGEAAGEDVDDAEAAAVRYVDERLIRVFWKSIRAGSMLEEVDVLHLVALVEQCLPRRGHVRLHERANPRKEALTLAFEVVHLRIHRLIDVQ